MKKVVLAVVLIGIAVIIGAPFANGLIMERVVKQACTDINKLYADTGHDLSIEIVDYRRGYASSQIKWKIALGKMQKIYGIEDIIVVDEAKHGYTGVVSKSSLAENKWFTALVDKKLNGRNPVDITTRYALLGNIESTVVLDAFSLHEGKDVMEIKPGKMVITCAKGLRSFSSQGSWDGLTVVDQLNLDGVSFFSDMEMISSYIWDGNGSVSVAHAKATANNELVEISNLTFGFAMDFEKTGNTVSVGADYGADHVIIEDKSIDNAFVRIGVNRMDAQGYENLVKIYSQMVNDTMSNMARAQNDPEKMQAALQKQMIANGLQLVTAFEKMLKNGLEIQISDLKASLPEGQVQGAVVLSLKKDMTMAQFFPIISQPKLALEIFALQSDLSLPASLVGDDPKLFAPLYPGMQTGLFEQKGKSIVHKAETRDGKLFLNGREVILD